MLLIESGEKLVLYKVDAENKKHEFWQRYSELFNFIAGKCFSKVEVYS
jgi:hypothetical protein